VGPVLSAADINVYSLWNNCCRAVIVSGRLGLAQPWFVEFKCFVNSY